MRQKWIAAAQKALLRPEAAARRDAAHELSRFLITDEGSAAQRLLAATRRHVLIAEARKTDNTRVIYALTRKGLTRFDGFSLIPYNFDLEPERIHFIHPQEVEEVVEAFSLLPKRSLDALVPLLRTSLTEIADSVLAE